MSTDLQQQKTNKSMFILLSIISILVISTLVVASIYFLKPTIEAPAQEPLSQPSIETQMDVEKVPVNPFMQSNPGDTQTRNMESPADIKKTTLAETTTTHPKPKTEKQSKQDNCDVRFFENQLLVKNADRK